MGRTVRFYVRQFRGRERAGKAGSGNTTFEDKPPPPPPEFSERIYTLECPDLSARNEGKGS